jgi:hypothetical protein
MVTAHREQMAAVREVDAERTAGDSPSRSVRLRLRNVAREEETLGQRAGELTAAIEAEGSQVTAELMRSVEGDLGPHRARARPGGRLRHRRARPGAPAGRPRRTSSG